MMFLPQFGKLPRGNERSKVEASANFQKGSFKNISPTEMMADNTSMPEMLWHFLNRPANCFPAAALPSVKTSLKNIQTAKPVITWFGHSSYLIQINQKNILVDPVFSGHASPFTFTAKSFPGSDIYGVDDMPGIDILILTHDHYDHLDYKTVTRLLPSVKLICTSLGVASHLVYWGCDKSKIIEFDWWDGREVLKDITLTAAPARHFSGRGLVRNKTLWSSFILQTTGHKIYIGGDSGYDKHFADIGKKFGPFDIVVLECGQYNTAWPYIHMMPEETAQAAIDLKANILLPVHWGKFSLSLHPWDEPIERVTAKAAELHVPVTTPMIGEQVIVGADYPVKHWWEAKFW
ncbi:MAG TPA: MBL fold metallo-hydrolase [Chitinophagaceae bacterium]|nr:MBL fold metallo-hydrolase [Chitinophagaceae bacterium]